MIHPRRESEFNLSIVHEGKKGKQKVLANPGTDGSIILEHINPMILIKLKHGWSFYSKRSKTRIYYFQSTI
jgi:hypothetical protein